MLLLYLFRCDISTSVYVCMDFFLHIYNFFLLDSMLFSFVCRCRLLYFIILYMVTTKTIRDIHVKVPTLLFGMASYTYTVKCYKVRLLETLRQKQTQALVNKLYCMLLPCVCVCMFVSDKRIQQERIAIFEGHTIATVYGKMVFWEPRTWVENFLVCLDGFFGYIHTHTHSCTDHRHVGVL